jgi:Ni2+-binding GTPase involved in maturation of urease and hydrogenase
MKRYGGDPRVIYIEVSGPTQTGKSAILASIKQLLDQYGYCVVIPDRAQRLNPPSPISSAASHEVPCKNHSVIILTERLTRQPELVSAPDDRSQTESRNGT